MDAEENKENDGESRAKRDEASISLCSRVQRLGDLKHSLFTT